MMTENKLYDMYDILINIDVIAIIIMIAHRAR